MSNNAHLKAKPMDVLPPVPPADWLLQHLVSMVTNTPLEIGITLQVSGLLVTGKLVSGVRYFEGIASDFAQGLAAYPEAATAAKDSFESFGKALYESAPDDDDASRESAPLNYVHLREAKFFSTAGNPIPAKRGLWWRGRISEVGGFTLGELQAQLD